MIYKKNHNIFYDTATKKQKQQANWVRHENGKIFYDGNWINLRMCLHLMESYEKYDVNMML